LPTDAVSAMSDATVETDNGWLTEFDWMLAKLRELDRRHRSPERRLVLQVLFGVQDFLRQQPPLTKPFSRPDPGRTRTDAGPASALRTGRCG
jgi:hypothetical protein